MAQKRYYRDKLAKDLQRYDCGNEIFDICDCIIDEIEHEIIDILKSIEDYNLLCAKSDLENLVEKLY